MSKSRKKTPDKCVVGETISFKLISKFDVVVYSGKIQAITDYDRARPFGDIPAIHSSMAASTEEELMDPRLDKYLIVKCQDNQHRPIGFQWIEDGLVEVISSDDTYEIKIYSTTQARAAYALSILRNEGYICKLVPKN